MKMSDVKIGMRLTSKVAGALSPITVTEITDRGFKYKLDAPIHLRGGECFAIDGHEHYGFHGWTDYQIEPSATFIEGSITDAYATGWRPDGFGG